jgi:hypothetical protein
MMAPTMTTDSLSRQGFLAGDRSDEDALEHHQQMLRQQTASLPHLFGEFKTS